MKNSSSYLKGLNTMRFFAAFFVIISHWQISMNKLGDYRFVNWAVFNRGWEAVEFFFTLSGFLITWLLQKEIARTSTVSIKEFYLRRVFRIWPLYFVIVLIAFVGLGLILPRVTGQRLFEFPLLTGALLFIFFLPNLASAMYPTAVLHPLWSIGVEEQYYLFWSPLVKLFRHKLIVLIGFFLTFSLVWYALVYYRMFPFSAVLRSFFLSQKFYAMAMGGLFGWIHFARPEQYRRSIFARPAMQWLVFLLIVWYFVVGVPGYPVIEDPFLHFGLAVLYGLLILNSSLLERPAINLEKQPFVYLGVISYGLYMYHMLVDYVLRYASIRWRLADRLGFGKLGAVYLVLMLGGTVLVSSLSYKYLESYFLRLKERHGK
ncbi:MAG TPA: acyltransferase [Puia sp.]|jgi:peptidoglycan/LPS O-acetylase OafA/YrhL|nr:acyltransferase [Puia sp.]